MHGPLTVGASLVAEHGSKGPRASVVVTLGLRVVVAGGLKNCGTQAELLCGM